VSLLHNDVDSSSSESYYVLFSTYIWNQTHHNEYLVQHRTFLVQGRLRKVWHTFEDILDNYYIGLYDKVNRFHLYITRSYLTARAPCTYNAVIISDSRRTPIQPHLINTTKADDRGAIGRISTAWSHRVELSSGALYYHNLTQQHYDFVHIQKQVEELQIWRIKNKVYSNSKYLMSVSNKTKSWDSSVCIATGYGLDGRGSIPGKGKKSFSNPLHPDRLRGPPNLISSAYWNYSGCGVKLTAHLRLVLRIRIVDPYLHSPTRLQGYPCNGRWKPIGLLYVEAPTFSRQSNYKWRWGQPHAPAALYPQEESWYWFLLETESSPEPYCGWKD
jgi:hypothetical protein